MAFVAKKIFITKGVGKHRERLSSFELALRSAGSTSDEELRTNVYTQPDGIQDAGGINLTTCQPNRQRRRHRRQRLAHPTNGTYISAEVSDPCRAARRVSPVSAGS